LFFSWATLIPTVIEKTLVKTLRICVFAPFVEASGLLLAGVVTAAIVMSFSRAARLSAVCALLAMAVLTADAVSLKDQVL